jgi:hypothetical protein
MLWIQLVMSTASTIAESGQPEFDWQEGVVLRLADKEFGTYLLDTSEYDEVVKKLGANVSDAGKLRDFVADLCRAVQLYNDAGERLDYFIGEEAP